jgi:hypothetical protein
MQLVTLSPTARFVYRATHKVIVAAADVAALATDSDTLDVFPTSGDFPAGTQIAFRGANLLTAFDFSDASIDSLTLQVGDTLSTNRFLDATQLAADGTEVIYGVPASVAQPFPYEPVGNRVRLTISCSGGASPLLSECTAGKVEIYFAVSSAEDLEVVKGGGPTA